MDKGELETYLQGGIETQAFEVKACMKWDDASLAKDILAMSNLRDGGHIVIGIVDGTFERQGVTEEVRNTYKIDEMRDKMKKWADPSVEFSVSFPTDNDGNQYVAITVHTFREIPVISRRNGADVREATIYYRTSDRRVESAPIGNSYDLRDLITTATARMGSNWKRLGIEVKTPSDEFRRQLDVELEDL